jgi:HD-GYP domain-containing protein (c-di-GMP phosphodiesterase class II)
VGAAPALASVARLVRSSHEWWDGTGYPDKLAGADIPLGARIISVCDAYDAMVSPRPYRPDAKSPVEALGELNRCAGGQFDPAIVSQFVAVMAERRARTLASAAVPA